MSNPSVFFNIVADGKPAMVNPIVFFNTLADGKPLGHVSFQLFADKVPRTAENVHTLSTREKGFVFF